MESLVSQEENLKFKSGWDIDAREAIRNAVKLKRRQSCYVRLTLNATLDCIDDTGNGLPYFCRQNKILVHDYSVAKLRYSCIMSVKAI